MTLAAKLPLSSTGPGLNHTCRTSPWGSSLKLRESSPGLDPTKRYVKHLLKSYEDPHIIAHTPRKARHEVVGTIVCLFGARRLSQQSYPSFPSPEKGSSHSHPAHPPNE